MLDTCAFRGRSRFPHKAFFQREPDHVLHSLTTALFHAGISPERVLLVSRTRARPHSGPWLQMRLCCGLEERCLPAAVGAKLADPGQTVVVESDLALFRGDGVRHFQAALRRNVDLTLLVRRPLSRAGRARRREMPPGARREAPFLNPIHMALALGGTFVARAWTGDSQHLAGITAAALRHKGFSVVEIIESEPVPAAFFRVRPGGLALSGDGVLFRRETQRAGRKLHGPEARLALGLLAQRKNVPVLETCFPCLEQGDIEKQPISLRSLAELLNEFG